MKNFKNTHDRNIIKEILLDKIRNYDSQVIVVKGKWGVGKTYLWDEICSELHKRDCNNKYKETGYVSLFGKTSLEDINKAALQAFYLSNQAKSKFNIFKTGISKAIEATGNNAKLTLALLGIDALLSVMNKTNLREAVICFDDLDRIKDDIPLKDFLGYVSQLSEKNKCNVIILVNDDIFFGNDKKQKIDSKETENDNPQLINVEKTRIEQYKLFKEKVIDLELTFEPTPVENFDIAIKLLKENKEAMKEEILKELKVFVNSIEETNIRILKKSLEITIDVFKEISTGSCSQYTPLTILINTFYLAAHYWKADVKNYEEYKLAVYNASFNTNKPYVYRRNNSEFEPRQDFVKTIFHCLVTGIKICNYKDVLIEEAEYFENMAVINKLKADYNQILENFVVKVNYSKKDFLKDIISHFSHKEYKEHLYEFVHHGGFNHRNIFSEILECNDGLYDDNFKNEIKKLVKPSAKIFIEKYVKWRETNTSEPLLDEKRRAIDFLFKIYPELKEAKMELEPPTFEELANMLEVFHSKAVFSPDNLYILTTLSENYVLAGIHSDTHFYYYSMSYLLYYYELKKDDQLHAAKGILSRNNAFYLNLINILSNLMKENLDIKYKLSLSHPGLYELIEKDE